MKTNMQDTSLDVYFAKVLPNIGKRQKQVLQVFRDKPSFNFTNMEVAYKLKWSINRVTGRVFELRKLGVLVEVERRKCDITKNMAKAWGLNDVF